MNQSTNGQRAKARPGSWLLALGLLLGLAACDGPPTRAQEAGVPITFTLERPGRVTLVIEDEAGHRVRNLISGTPFEAGTHTIYWDGLDEGRVVNHRPNRGDVGYLYDIERAPVPPGTYLVRGLFNPGLRLRYVLPVQSPGTPPWHTPDGSGAWLSDHTPPMDVVYLPEGSPWGDEPQLLVGASIAEAGHALMWLDERGRKRYGMRIGWEGGYALARDADPSQPAYAYAVNVRKGRQLTVFALLRDGTHRDVYTRRLETTYAREDGLAAAAYRGTIVISLPHDRQLLVLEGGARQARQAVRATMPLDGTPRGLAVDAGGRLWVVVGREVRRYRMDWERARLGAYEVVVADHLEAPQHLAFDARGRIYVSDWGSSHQVKVFSPEGMLERVLGRPGGPRLGAYDPQRMHHPGGMAVDGEGKVWVAEISYAPKRISVWLPDGTLYHAFYGPPKYGGGGVLDPRDPTHVYYVSGGLKRREEEEEGGNKVGLRFRLDWAARTAEPDAVYLRAHDADLVASLPSMGPDQPLYAGGHRYLTNTFSQASHGMKNVVGLWLWQPDSTLRLVAVAGYPMRNLNRAWFPLERPELQAGRPPDVPPGRLFFVWSDLDLDSRVEPDEVQYRIVDRGPGLTAFDRDLSILTSWLGHVAAPEILLNGVPRYDLETWSVLGEIERGNGDVIRGQDGTVIVAGGPVEGFRDGERRWLIHSPWYKRAEGPVPAEPGLLVETSRILGPPFELSEGEAGEVWALNNDKGGIYLITTDGLFLQELGGDARVLPVLRVPDVQPGDYVDGYSFGEEHFWPTITRVETSGEVYLMAGKEFSALFRVEGFEGVRRLDLGTITVSGDQAGTAQAERIEASRQAARVASIPIRRHGPRLDGDLSDWEGAAWLPIEPRLGLEAAVMVAADTLYLAYRVGDPGRLRNEGRDGVRYLFATGGGLDLMLRVDNARPAEGQAERPRRTGRDRRERPARGAGADGDGYGVRLFITRIGDPEHGPVEALRFQERGPAPREEAFTYTSPVGTTRFRSVRVVGPQVRLAQSGGDYEVALPLDLLGLYIEPGIRIRADVGVLFGDGLDTRARYYWSNKTYTMVSDVPTEARLTPEVWGTWQFVPEE